jgi:hypothetical protein
MTHKKNEEIACFQVLDFPVEGCRLLLLQDFFNLLKSLDADLHDLKLKILDLDSL